MLTKVAKASTVTLPKVLSHVAVADGFANKCRRCKQSIKDNRHSFIHRIVSSAKKGLLDGAFFQSFFFLDWRERIDSKL
jgi:hypothetical protein